MNGGGTPLDDRARSVWAKTFVAHSENHELIGWLPLHQHLADAAGIATLLWDGWAPPSVKRFLSESIGSEASARALLVWLAGTHDIGKASPAFAVQNDVLADQMRHAGLVADARIRDSDERRKVRHELVSFLAIRERLHRVHGLSRSQAGNIASVAAAHHGRPADPVLISSAQDRPHLVGVGEWASTREDFLAWAESGFADAESIAAWRDAKLSQPALALLSALVIVADWIASSDLFPSAALGREAAERTDVRVRNAWEQLDLPRPWNVRPETTDAATLLAQRFDLPAGATPHPAQEALVTQALGLERAELLIMEAEMGSGKTEAALLAAEILAGKFGMSGIFLGLPTQATTDGMFSRVLSWADRLGLETPSSVFLARSRAQLNPEYAHKIRERFFRSIGDSDTASTGSLMIAHRWFSDARRGPLADFVVGTVDQALFAGLRSRYLMLRHLALAGKVVVIDEVHAYDDYMDHYLVRVLEWLGAYGVPVILLSATLPSQKRREFIEAYDIGRRALNPEAPRAKRTWAKVRALQDAEATAEDSPAARPYDNISGLIGYPAITVSNGTGSPRVTTAAPSRESRSVTLDRIDDEPGTLIDAIREALREGGNIAVIRNTVRRAQETAAILRDAFPDVLVTVAHSRFLGLDRARKDRELLDRYGPRGNRPSGSIVVATQVIEQSLDVDFDLLVTDITPVDLLFQRMGRLHRHHRPGRPAALHPPRVVLTGVDWTATPPEPDSGSTAVYGDLILLRTLAALHDRETVSLPDDIAPLVEAVYDHTHDLIPASWHPAHDSALRTHRERIAEKQRKASTFSLRHVKADVVSLTEWINGPDTDPELTPPGRATVRDGEETLEVIVLQRDEYGILRTPTWLLEGGGIQIPTTEPPDSALTRTLLGCFLRLPVGMCRGNALDRHITALERAFELPSWHASHALKGELTLVFDQDGRGRLNEFDLFYSPEDGFEYSRRD